MKGLLTRALIALCLPLVAAAAAGAATVAPALSVDLTIGIGEATTNTIVATTAPSTTTTGAYDGSATVNLGSDTVAITLCVKPDPFITSSFTITNGSTTTQTFSLLSILPVAPPLAAPSLMNGHISGTVTDGNSNGATVSTNGTNPLYQGWIDGSVVASTALYPDPLSWSAGAIPYASFTNLPGGAVSNNIGIKLNFTLSAGDSVTLDSFFEVVPVPEPASLGLVGIVLLGFAAARRRA